MDDNDYVSIDFIIIGSGVSGGRVAYNLTVAGATCLLLEAGHEYSATTFPNNELDYSSQLFWGGGLEVSQDGRLGFLRAKCLGGTSIVNQALLDRFDERVWSDWKARSGIEFFSEKEMARWYDDVEKQLKISEVPKDYYNRNAHLFTEAFDKKGYGWSPLHRAQGDCKLDQGSDCMVCLGGCPRDSKQSSLVTTIRWARKLGLKVESEVEVQQVVHESDRVRVIGKRKNQILDFEAERVFLAAGALGNSSILLRSGYKKSLPALGKGFSCHPQFMTYALFDEPVDAHKGAFQAVKSDDIRLKTSGYKLENVFAPPIGTAMLVPGYGNQHSEIMKKYRHMASIEVALRDQPNGEIKLASNGKILIEKSLHPEDRVKGESGLQFVKGLFESVGAKKIIQCRQAFGLHLMGGCTLGTDPKTSVVNPEFQVHGFPRLYAADSSIFPEAPGINPSFTIMALSQKASQQVAGAKG